MGVAAAILVVGGIAIAVGSSLFGGSETVSVPTLRGMTVEEASSELALAGLRLGTPTPEASDEESGTIIDQDPSAGEQIQQGQAVNVTVSAGPEEVLVPQLVGLDSDDAAEAALQEVGLVLGTTTPRDSDQPEGFVLESDPVAGSTAAEGDRVDIVVSSGFLSVPDVVGQTEDSARSDISAAGLEAEVVFQTGTSGVGTVVAQSPDGGARAKKGDTVTINVVQAPEPTPDSHAHLRKPRPRRRRLPRHPRQVGTGGSPAVRAGAPVRPSPAPGSSGAARPGAADRLRLRAYATTGARPALAATAAGSPHTPSQLASMRWPDWVSTLSGWNWTPSIGRLRCRRPMMTPDSDRAETSRSAGTVPGSRASEWYRVARTGFGTPSKA